MKVYNFSNNKAKGSRYPLARVSTYSNHNRNNKNRKQPTENFLSKAIENKFVSQITAMFFLTVAVFIAVQGLFGSGASTIAQAAGSDSNVRLIINYNTSGVVDKTQSDNSTLVDAAPVTPVVDTATTQNQVAKLQNVSAAKNVSIVPASKK